MELLVDTAWLEREGAGLHILDATLLDPALGRDARAEFRGGHIPGARFLDLATLVERGASLPNTLPPADLFATRLGELGVAADDRIVLYDDSPWHTAARGWWMLRLFGAEQVAILDGGLARWKAEGRPLERGEAPASAATFTAVSDPAPLRDLAAMRANLASGAEQVIDARSAARFAGAEPESRAGVVPGHIPASLSLPYTGLFEPDGGWKRGERLRAAFEAAGMNLARPTIATCGSGITACVLLFGLALLGKKDVALYDGSWSEWGADPATPKATGTA
jgi:thiosulfate/3-mercaptopyruvate sulfurtransferase